MKSQWEKMNPEMSRALKNARSFARMGNAMYTQYWLGRANSFAEVSRRQVQALQTMLQVAQNRKRLDEIASTKITVCSHVRKSDGTCLVGCGLPLAK